jgi:N-acetylmuramoyl-L-alanine amidase
VKHPSFPNTISGVIYQPYAFSCVNDGQINLPVKDICYQAAQDALNGVDPSGGAVFYFNPAKTSNKFMHSLKQITVTIGGHIFAKG